MFYIKYYSYIAVLLIWVALYWSENSADNCSLNNAATFWFMSSLKLKVSHKKLTFQSNKSIPFSYIKLLIIIKRIIEFFHSRLTKKYGSCTTAELMMCYHLHRFISNLRHLDSGNFNWFVAKIMKAISERQQIKDTIT